MNKNTEKRFSEISNEIKLIAESELRKSINPAYKDVKNDERLKQILINDICKELEDIARTHGEAGLRWLMESIQSENERLEKLIKTAMENPHRLIDPLK